MTRAARPTDSPTITGGTVNTGTIVLPRTGQASRDGRAGMCPSRTHRGRDRGSLGAAIAAQFGLGFAPT